MTPTSDHTAAVLTQLSHEPAGPDDMPDLVGQLQRLCRTARRDLQGCGAGVSVVLQSGYQVAVAASDPASALVEDLQFAMGEGPCLAAYASRIPIQVPDLSEAALTTWPGYGPAAYDHGVRAVFAFPLQFGHARLGAFNVYRDEPGPLSAWALSRGLAYANVAMRTMLEAQQCAGGTASLLAEGDDARFDVYRAQGMVMAKLGVGAAEALSRMRGCAYANDRRLQDMAGDIVGRRGAATMVFPDPDEDCFGVGAT